MMRGDVSESRVFGISRSISKCAQSCLGGGDHRACRGAGEGDRRLLGGLLLSSSQEFPVGCGLKVTGSSFLFYFFHRS